MPRAQPITPCLKGMPTLPVKRTRIPVDGIRVYWVNPPFTVYDTNSFCIRCRGLFSKHIKRCPNCHTQVRKNSRHRLDLRHDSRDVKRY